MTTNFSEILLVVERSLNLAFWKDHLVGFQNFLMYAFTTLIYSLLSYFINGAWPGRPSGIQSTSFVSLPLILLSLLHFALDTIGLIMLILLLKTPKNWFADFKVEQQD